MTPPRAPGGETATRPPLVLLIPLYLIPFVAALATPVADFLGPQGDVSLYLDKARGVAALQAPYRDIPLEYPPLALVPMVVPYVLWPFGPPSLNVYAWLFAGGQAFLLVALALVLGRIVSLGGLRDAPPTGARFSSQTLVALRLLLLAAFAALAITWRFDLFPALLATVAVWAALGNRPVGAGIAIGAGALAKLFPLVLVPSLAAAWLAPVDGRRLVRFGEAALATAVLGMAPFVALAGVDALLFVGYQAARGLQIESIGGGLVLLDGLVRGERVPLIAPFSAHEVTGPLAAVALSATSVLTVAGFGLLAWLGWRRVGQDRRQHGGATPASIVALATGSILVLLVTSKVFSIQYVVWLVPFAALLPAWQFRLAAAIVALTLPIHPLLYDALVSQEAVPVLVLNARNALLVALLALVVRDLWRESSESSRLVSRPS